MDIRKMDKDDLELLSFKDMAFHLIKMDKEAKSTIVLFKEICKLLEMSNEEYEGLIAEFFTSLTTDKRFILLNSSNWDLKENHVINVVVDDSEEDFDEPVEDFEDSEEHKEVEDEYDLDQDGIDDLNDDEEVEEDDDLDELDNLEIIDEDAELEE